MRKVSRVPYVICAVVLGLCMGILMTWSMYRTAFLEMFPGWTAGNLSLVYSVHNIANAVLVLTAGFLVRKVKPQYLVRTAGFLFGLGLTLISFLPVGNEKVAFVMLTVCYGLIAAPAVGCMHPTLVSTFIKWFPDREGFINGMVMFPTMFASFVFGTLVQKLIPAVGLLMTFRILGIGVFCIVMIGSFWAVNPAPDILLPARPEFKENRGDKDFSVKQALACPAFWAVFFFRFSASAAGLTYTDHAASIALYFGLAALIGMLYSPIAGIAGITMGSLLNRLRVVKTWMLVSSAVVLAVVLLLVATATGIQFLAIIGILCIGFTFGSTNATVGAVVRILFGAKNSSAIYGLAASTSTICAALVGAFSGKLVDMMDGSYYGVFIVMGVFAVINVLSVAGLGLYLKRRDAVYEK